MNLGVYSPQHSLSCLSSASTSVWLNSERLIGANVSAVHLVTRRLDQTPTWVSQRPGSLCWSWWLYPHAQAASRTSAASQEDLPS